MTNEPLGTFDDRYTMRYIREYPHPVERVWEALVTAEHLDIWMMPANEVDAREGGRFDFTFQGPRSHPGTICELRLHEVVDYAFDDGGHMRFELTPTAEGTRLAFLHSFPAGFISPPADDPDDPGADLPGGPDTPWRPGFTAGFHLCLHDLGVFLDGDPVHRPPGDEDWHALLPVYREHIKASLS